MADAARTRESVVVEVSTSDLTVTNLFTKATTSGIVYLFVAHVIAVRASGEKDTWVSHAAFENTSATLTQLTSSPTTVSSHGSLNYLISWDISSETARLRVQGGALQNVDWIAYVDTFMQDGGV